MSITTATSPADTSPLSLPSRRETRENGSRGIFMGESRFDTYEESSVLLSMSRLDAAAKRRNREKELEDELSRSNPRRARSSPGANSRGSSSTLSNSAAAACTYTDGSIGSIGSGFGLTVSSGRSWRGSGRLRGDPRWAAGMTVAFCALCAAAWLTSGDKTGAPAVALAVPGTEDGVVGAYARSLKKRLAGAVLGDREIEEEEERKLRSSSDGDVARNLSRILSTGGGGGGRLIADKDHPPLRVLSLGGSTTWGSQLERREDAYPHVLADRLLPYGSTVTNVALRATGSDYAGMCLQTMVAEHCNGPDALASLVGKDGLGDVNYDVVTVEYSLNGLHGLPLLLRRLRRRYPTAPIVYVHLWSIRETVSDARTNEAPRRVINDPDLTFREADAKMRTMLSDREAKWVWDRGMTNDSEGKLREAERMLAEAMKGSGEEGNDDGIYHVHQLPVPDDPRLVLDAGWFGPDFHHLSRMGHLRVAQGLKGVIDSVVYRSLLRQRDAAARGEALAVKGRWGTDGSDGDVGDECVSWYETGETPKSIHEGGKIKMFVKPDKYAHHVSKNKWGGMATIEFENTFDRPMELGLTTMVWGKGVYPRTRITVTPVPDDSPESGQRPFYILDPLHSDPTFSSWHVTHTFFAGLSAMPGKNVVTVEPLEETKRPLRVTGLVMCVACSEDGNGQSGGGAAVLNQEMKLSGTWGSAAATASI